MKKISGYSPMNNRSYTPSYQMKYYTKNLNENERKSNKIIQQYINKRLYELQKDNSVSTNSTFLKNYSTVNINSSVNIKKIRNSIINRNKNSLRKNDSSCKKYISFDDIHNIKEENIKLENELKELKYKYKKLNIQLQYLLKKADTNIFQMKAKSIIINGKTSSLIMNNSEFKYNDSINSLSSREEDIKKQILKK